MKKLNNQRGFAVVEAILALLLVGAMGAVGYLAYQNHKLQIKKTSSSTSSTAKSTTTPTTSSTSTQATPAPSDTDLIVAAVKAKGIANASGGTSPVDTVTVTDIVGANAKGDFGSSSADDGAEFIAHKSGSQWSVIFEGQEKPGEAIGQQYSLPADWYSTDY